MSFFNSLAHGDSKVKKYPKINLQHEMPLEFFLPAELYSLRLYLPCSNIHLYYHYSFFFSAVLLEFHSLRGHGKDNYWVGGKGNHIQASQRTVKWKKRQGWYLTGWLWFQFFTTASILMAGACVVVEYFEFHLWVETHLQEIKLALLHCQNICWAPNCGSHFSFIVL